ncbi:MAG: TldD/PmbA family protein, partial [Chloroflexi bacterium]|nr:TldD/PmbA family protein [Chloroflexota bacterium]
GTLVGPLSIGFNGKTVFEGTSPLKGKLGQRLFDSKLDLADDPLESFLPESRPCDDEGLPSRRNTLVNQGRVAGFLYDLQTGGMAGVPSTARANRGRGPMPGPGITCLVFGNGDMGFDDMVSNIGEGLVVDHLMGAEQGNVLGGDFSGNVLLGYVVDRGRIAGRAKNVMVSGNVYQALQHIVTLSKETKLVYGAVRAPYVWLEGLAVAAKESD